jgi:hypothetical protein
LLDAGTFRDGCMAERVDRHYFVETDLMLVLRIAQVRWLPAGWLVGAVVCSVAWADVPAEVPAILPQAREVSLNIAPGVVPKPGGGERLLLETSDGEPQVVELYSKLGNDVLVMLPTGELKQYSRGQTRPTDRPFVGADEAAMRRALDEAGFSQFKVTAGGPYLYVYDCSEGFFLHTRSILESMFPGVVRTLRGWGLELDRPTVPQIVVIMPSREAFDAYDKVPPEIAAYYNQLTNYVVLYEDQRLWEAAPEYAAKQAAYTIAHEGVHQLLHNTGVQKRLSRWPMWIGEGLPEYFCPLKVNTRLIRQKDSELPARTIKWTEPGMVNDLRMHALLRINSQSGEVARRLVRDNELDTDEYALAWGLVHFLASKQPEKFQAYLRDVSKFEPLDAAQREAAGRADPLFAKHFGEDFAAVEAAVQKHLTSKPMQAAYVDPEVNQTHYVVKRVVKKGRAYDIALIITTSPASARKWKEEQETEHPRAKFFTKVCKTQREAEYQLKKLQNL